MSRLFSWKGFILLALVAAGLVIAAQKIGPTAIKPTLDASTSVQERPESPVKTSTVALKPKVSIPLADLETGQNLSLVTLEHEEKSKEPLVIEMEQLKKQLSEHLSQQQNLQDQRDQKVEALSAQVAEQQQTLVALNQAFAALRQRTEGLSKEMAVKKSRRDRVKTVKRSPKDSKQPDFTLVTIDQWGGEAIAVIRSQDQRFEKKVRESLGDWEVVSITRESRQINLKDRNGRFHTLSLNTPL